ncbi:MAG TPA: PLDc N-terminal domain-containing protein [Cyclobacteriaceae bacterium]|nr:PLDc N-terminal domain-containing protein [Cyclobacteriaceae bacterium]
MIRLIFPFLYLILVIYFIIQLLDSNRTTNQKFLWVLLIIFFPVGGIVLYLLLSGK